MLQRSRLSSSKSPILVISPAQQLILVPHHGTNLWKIFLRHHRWVQVQVVDIDVWHDNPYPWHIHSMIPIRDMFHCRVCSHTSDRRMNLTSIRSKSYACRMSALEAGGCSKRRLRIHEMDIPEALLCLCRYRCYYLRTSDKTNSLYSRCSSDEKNRRDHRNNNCHRATTVVVGSPRLMLIFHHHQFQVAAAG